MGLLPLEFVDCLTDSPSFRENLHAHEKELERTSQAIKGLIKDVKDLLAAAKNLSKTQRNFATNLINFKLECIGTTQTDDEIEIAVSLMEFGKLIHGIEDERDRMLERAYDQFVHPLEQFRKEHIGSVKHGKKKFDKQTAKFCQSIEKHANLTTKKNENTLQESDANIGMEQLDFQKASLRYVFLLQEVQERKKFEFVETVLGFMYGWLTFYHQGHEVAKDFKPFMLELQVRLQKTRENFNSTRTETESLMNKMLEVRKTKGQDPGCLNKNYTRQGYLFLMEKKAFGTTAWIKHYCLYQKQSKILTMIPYTQTTAKITGTDSLMLKSCVRRSTESIEKRFCFDITADRSFSSPGVITLQALSEEDRKLWLDAMDGKEPVSLDDQGLYRLVGVSSKVNKLIQMGLDRRKAEKLNFDDVLEWENKTITSALKTYFRNLPEPLMTFNLHEKFIAAAKLESCTQRINHVHYYVHQLPKLNIEMLDILIQHLKNVSSRCEKNLMTVSNLGVCFGPTLLRPEEESVAAIMEIKFCNIVVEIMIENCEKILKTTPNEADLTKPDTSPTKPAANANSAQPPKPHNSFSTKQPVSHAVVTTYNTELPMSVNTLGIPTSLTAAPQTPVVPSRQKTARVKPLVIFNPICQDGNHNLGSNSSSSTESVNSRSSRELNNRHSPNSSPSSSGKLGLLSSSSYRPSEHILSNVKKRHSVDSILAPSTVRTLYHCEGENESELSFEPNQIITNVRPSREPGWVEGTLNGKTGLIPQNYIEYLP
uniref:Rho GTPase-activating protein 26 n=1 Tax=Strigamia maritima TaxID=126957 RepID=T1JFW8_STRMM